MAVCPVISRFGVELKDYPPIGKEQGRLLPGRLERGSALAQMVHWLFVCARKGRKEQYQVMVPGARGRDFPFSLCRKLPSSLVRLFQVRPLSS